jgi:hypothetical protein
LISRDGSRNGIESGDDQIPISRLLAIVIKRRIQGAGGEAQLAARFQRFDCQASAAFGHGAGPNGARDRSIRK